MAATTRNYGVQNKVPKLRYAGNDVMQQRKPVFWEEAVGNVQHGETKFHFSFNAVLFPNSADQVAAWTGQNFLPLGPRCNCVTLQRCCLQRLQEYWAKTFPFTVHLSRSLPIASTLPIMELTKAVCRDTTQGKLIFPQVCVCGAWPGN